MKQPPRVKMSMGVKIKHSCHLIKQQWKNHFQFPFFSIKGSADPLDLLKKMIFAVFIVGLFVNWLVPQYANQLKAKAVHEDIQEIQIEAIKACKRGSGLTSIDVPDNTLYALRTCDLWECKGDCKNEEIPGTKMVLDTDLKEDVYDKHCKVSNKELAALCFINYKKSKRFWFFGKERLKVEKKGCTKVNCGIPYNLNLLAPGQKRYRVQFSEAEESIEAVLIAE